jgi:hypothetical protein
MPDDRPSELGALRALGLVAQLGLTMVVPAVGGAMVGWWVGSRTGGEALLVIAGTLLGVAVGALGVWQLIAKEAGWKR